MAGRRGESNNSVLRIARLNENERAYMALMEMKKLEKDIKRKKRFITVRPDRRTIVQTTRVGYFTEFDTYAKD